SSSDLLPKKNCSGLGISLTSSDMKTDAKNSFSFSEMAESSLSASLSSHITSLELNANKIVSIKNNIVSELKNLKELYMDQNGYYSNPCGKTFEKEDEAFVALTNLTVLSLSYNNLIREPLNLPSSLRELYLGFNKITRISQGDFNELVNLHLLDLSRNCPRCCNAPFPCEPCIINSSIQIHQFAFQNLKKLKILVLTSTSLTSVPAIWLQNMTQLKALHLAFNYLQNEIASGLKTALQEGCGGEPVSLG
uniref:Toll-like receptor 8 n=1 Tax=Gopherus agassizii TaxID=38772 RepID=A0A452IGT5_9SAUR